MKRIRATAVILGTTLLTLSCSQKSAVAVYPVRGTVLYRDKPAAGARVVFHPVNSAAHDQPVPQATVDADGSFRLSTYTQHDGAPPGTYAVTVQWSSDSVKEEDGTPVGPDRLQGRYGDPKKTPLRIEVRAERNELKPFLIK